MKYSRTLDYVLASLREAKAGRFEIAAKCLDKASQEPDLKETLAALEEMQETAFKELCAKTPTVASIFDAVVAKQTAKKAKKAEAKKEPVKAAEDEDDIEPILKSMTKAEEDGEGIDNDEPEDLSIEDLEDLDDGGDEDVLEMPEASAKTTAADSDSDKSDEKDDKKEDEKADADSDEKKDGDKDEEKADDKSDEKKDEEKADSDEKDDEDEDDKDEDKEESKSTAKVVKANLAALERLAKTKTKK